MSTKKTLNWFRKACTLAYRFLMSNTQLIMSASVIYSWPFFTLIGTSVTFMITAVELQGLPIKSYQRLTHPEPRQTQGL